MIPELPCEIASGRYQLTELLGIGGFSRVYRANDALLNVTRAVKFLGLGAREQVMERFLHEARAMAALQHPNVLTIYDVGHSAFGDFIVMELARGGSLAHLIRRHGPLAPDRAAVLMGQMLSALSCLHPLGIIHRDIKPSNLLLSAQGQLKLADFGVAMLAEDTNADELKGAELGTRAFMPPEQRNGEPLDHRADIFAAGSTMYALLTGDSPQELESTPMDSPRWLRLPAAFRDPIAKACSSRPGDRPSDSRELALSFIRAAGLGAAAEASVLQNFHLEDPQHTLDLPALDLTPSVTGGSRSLEESLHLRAEAMQRARRAVLAGEENPSTIRRLVQAIAMSAEDGGYEHLAQVAREVSYADAQELEARLDLLEIVLGSAISEARHRRSVVIVEDDPTTQAILAAAVGRLNTRVLTASSAHQARAQLLSSTPVLVLLDLVLPDEDGRELMLWMREQPGLRHVPVLMISATTTETVRSECLALGAEDLLAKPIDIHLLTDLVSRRLVADSRETDHAGRERWLEELRRCQDNYAVAQRPYSVALVCTREPQPPPRGFLSRLRLAMLRHLPDASVTLWDERTVAVLLDETPIAAAELGMRAVLNALDRDSGPVGVSLAAGVVEPMHAPAEDALYLARRMARMACTQGAGQVAGTTCATPAPQSAVLVDDDEEMLNLIGEVLRHSGVDIQPFSDPRAIEHDLDELPAGVFIVDLHMPGIDGYDLIRTLRAHPRHKRTPIVVVTGTHAPEAIEKCFALGADDFVTKPFHTKALMARVTRLLRREH